MAQNLSFLANLRHKQKDGHGRASVTITRKAARFIKEMVFQRDALATTPIANRQSPRSQTASS
jgi:hypothetical protein